MAHWTNLDSDRKFDSCLINLRRVHVLGDVLLLKNYGDYTFTQYCFKADAAAPLHPAGKRARRGLLSKVLRRTRCAPELYCWAITPVELISV